MTLNSIGDLAISLQLRRQNADLKTDLTRLSQELSSGVVSDIGTKLGGNYSGLAVLERGMTIAESYLVGISERRLDNSTTQSALEKLRTLGQVSESLLTVQETGDTTLVRNAGEDALARFASAIQTLNIQSGGRTVFAGIANDGPAVAEAGTILSAIEAEIVLAGAVTSGDISTVVDNWFGVGGGYDTIGYVGDVAATTGTRLSASETASPQTTAQDDNVRSFLGALTKGALIGRDILLLDPVEQGSLARIAGEGLMSADSNLIDLKASVGISEAQVERASVEVRSEFQALEFARNDLIAVDPFDTAVRLENTQTQLETLYAVTARLSGLSLVNYL